jgi:hypothetical protein
MFRREILGAALLVLVFVDVNAQVGRDIAERASNRSQISQGKKAVERDSTEINVFSEHLASLKKASQGGDEASVNQAFSLLVPLLRTEVEQGAGKAEAAKKELAGSVSETGSNRRESRRNRDDSDAFGRSSDDEADAARDAVNRVDDVRDLADDKKDLQATVGRVTRQQEIAQVLATYEFALGSDAGRGDAAEKIAMLEEFEALMRQDLAATVAEIKEDRREAGEDRRETRDDLREADEPDNQYRRKTGNYGRRGR